VQEDPKFYDGKKDLIVLEGWLKLMKLVFKWRYQTTREFALQPTSLVYR